MDVGKRWDLIYARNVTCWHLKSMTRVPSEREKNVHNFTSGIYEVVTAISTIAANKSTQKLYLLPTYSTVPDETKCAHFANLR